MSRFAGRAGSLHRPSISIVSAEHIAGMLGSGVESQLDTLNSSNMDRVLSLTTFDEERHRNSALEYWLSRPPEERIAEVERLRREYFQALRGADYDGRSEGLCRSLLLIERTGR